METAAVSDQTIHVMTVDTEFSTHPGEVGLTGRLGGEEFGVTRLADICRRHGVRATFFVDVCNTQGERERLMREAGLRLREAGHDLQLHTHPEWAHDPTRSRMCEYELDEQVGILTQSRARFERWFGVSPVAYRAGDWSANDHTLAALRAAAIPVDSSLFFGWPPCELTNPEGASNRPRRCGDVLELPPTIFKGRGPGRPYRLLSTDGQPYGEVAAVVRRLTAGGSPVLVSVYHSFSFLGWNRRRTRYWVERNDVRKFERFVEAIARDDRAEHLTVRELYERYRREPAFLLERPNGVPESSVRFVVPKLLERASSLARRWVSP